MLWRLWMEKDWSVTVHYGAVYFVMFHYFWGGGGWGMGKSEWNFQVRPFEKKLPLSSQSFRPCSPWIKSLIVTIQSCCFMFIRPIQRWFRLAFESNGWNSVVWRFIENLFSCTFTRNYLLFMQYYSKSKWNYLHFNLYIKVWARAAFCLKK